MRETHARREFRGILPAVRKNNQFAPARILMNRLHVAIRQKEPAPAFGSRSAASGPEIRCPVAPNSYRTLDNGTDMPAPRSQPALVDGGSRMSPFGPCICGTRYRKPRTACAFPPSATLPSAGTKNAGCHCRCTLSWLHLLSRRLRTVWCRPEHRISSVIAVKRRHVRRCFQIRMVRAQVPFVRIDPRPPVSAQKNFSARFAIKQLHYS